MKKLQPKTLTCTLHIEIFAQINTLIKPPRMFMQHSVFAETIENAKTTHDDTHLSSANLKITLSTLASGNNANAKLDETNEDNTPLTKRETEAAHLMLTWMQEQKAMVHERQLTARQITSSDEMTASGSYYHAFDEQHVLVHTTNE